MPQKQTEKRAAAGTVLRLKFQTIRIPCISSIHIGPSRLAHISHLGCRQRRNSFNWPSDEQFESRKHHTTIEIMETRSENEKNREKKQEKRKTNSFSPSGMSNAMRTPYTHICHTHYITIIHLSSCRAFKCLLISTTISAIHWQPFQPTRASRFFVG